MSEFVTLECKYCGNADRSTFIIRESEYICKCCGRAYRENATGGESRTAMAFEMLKNYDFSSAENIFSDIVSEYPESIDARWGLLLARYGIVFVKGFYMGEIEPIYCFPNVSYSKGAFTDEPEYREIENLLGADAKRMELYRAQAEQIDSALGVYRGDVCKEKEYDVFICVKISKTTANNPFAKGTTEDYEKACELYGKLRERGKRVFFSYVTLKNTIDSDIEIWRSLLKSKKMLLIGSRTEYFNSVWVKSEWERWLWLDTAGGDEHKKNLYIYVLGSESDNLYSKLPAGIKKFQPQIYTAETEADLLNDICYEEGKKPRAEDEERKRLEREEARKRREAVAERKREEKEEARRKAREAAKRRAPVWLNIITLLAIIGAAVVIPICVPGALHWCIAIAGGITVNVLIGIISEKTFEGFNILEVIAFVVLHFIALSIGNVFLIYGLGLAIGSLLTVIYRYKQIGASEILISIDSVMLILAILGLISNSVSVILIGTFVLTVLCIVCLDKK